MPSTKEVAAAALRARNLGREEVRSLIRGHPALSGRELKSAVVVLVHFNPCNYETPERNLLVTLDYLLEEQADVFAVELLCGDRFGQQSLLPVGSNTVVTLESKTVWFHKEGLWNVAERHLPKQVERLLFIDADVVFAQPGSIGRAFDVLGLSNVVQPYVNALYLGPEGDVITTRQSMAWASSIGRYDSSNPRKFHAGFSIGVTRSFWDAVGGFHLAPIGGGDTLLLAALLGSAQSLRPELLQQSPQAWGEYEQFAQSARRWSGGRVAFSENDIIHQYHGQPDNRRYEERKRILAGFDPTRDLEVNPHTGVAEWSSVAEAESAEMVGATRQYFRDRREDTF